LTKIGIPKSFGIPKLTTLDRFKEQWDNYEVATGIKEESAKKRGAIFLTCIGMDAYDVYRSMEFETGVDKKKIDVITTAFKAFCVGNVNVTYERYVFNKVHKKMAKVLTFFLATCVAWPARANLKAYATR
jgi:hypothetical protein